MINICTVHSLVKVKISFKNKKKAVLEEKNDCSATKVPEPESKIIYTKK